MVCEIVGRGGRVNVLITGGTGLLGQALLSTLGAGHHITLLHRRDYKQNDNGIDEVVLDILDRESLADLFLTRSFDAVIHAAGIASVDYAEQHEEEAWRSNVLGTQNVLDEALKKDLHFTFVSSNAVFDGQHAPYRENDQMNPVNRYGRMKVECETLIKRRCPEAAIVRPILMYGWQPPQTRTNPVTWLLHRLTRSEPTYLVSDVYENPLWSCHCAQAIWRVIELAKAGIFHIAGGDVVNRYELAKAVAAVFGLDAALLHPVDSTFFPNIAPRPRNTSFLTERMQDELGMVPLSLVDGLSRMRSLCPPGIP